MKLKNNFNLAVSPEQIAGSSIYLDSETIVESINGYANFRNEGYEVTCQNILIANSHFLRKKVLNEVFELISHYFKDSEHWSTFHTYNWFQVLYLLRNNASHFDNYNNIITFPKWKWLISSYPEVVEWDEIKIVNGQYGHDIQYNDRQVLDLITLIAGYFDQHEGKFN